MRNRNYATRSSRLVGAHGRVVLTTVALVLVGAGCGGGSETIPAGVTASFSGSGTAVQSNGVRLVGGSATDAIVTIEVVCGETDRADVYGFAFDLLLADPSVATFVAGSAAPGSALNGSVIATASQIGGRVVVGVTQTDQTGDKITGPESVVVRLAFRVLKTGMTEIRFGGSTGSNSTTTPAAISSSGDPIESVAFDKMPATIIGR